MASSKLFPKSQKAVPPPNWAQALVRWLDHLPERDSIALSLGGLAILLLLDYLTGRNFSFVALYLFPVCLAVWTLGRNAGLAIGAAATFGTAALNGFGTLFATETEIGISAALWNTVMRFVLFAIVAIIVDVFHRIYRLVRSQADTDGLTGLLNKRGFHNRMQGTLQRAQRKGGMLLLAFMDLDGFKSVNDTYGHAAGDDVLRAFADAAGGAMRATDHFARVGGDEFIALMPITDLNSGYAAAERLHAALSRTLREMPYKVTCSMGALVVQGVNVEGQEDILSLADGLLYEVKRAGKNALRIASIDLHREGEDLARGALAEAAE